MTDANNSRSTFDVDRIRELIQLMEDHGLTEIDLAEGDERIGLKRGGAAPVAPIPMMPAQMPAAAGPAASVPAAADDPNIVTIEAPVVGTFYAKPKPDSPDFVTVGQAITPDTIVCIVEAMKVFNEIPAEVKGKIVEILVADQTPVQFGTPLFKVDIS
ncbi:MAG: acetyl-CoA carboxylase biotin carboxyl carrier protein [Planctomycetota bacterium]